MHTHINRTSIKITLYKSHMCVCVCVQVLEVREEWQEERKQIKLAHQRQMNSLKDKHNTIVQKMEQDSATETAKATEVHTHHKPFSLLWSSYYTAIVYLARVAVYQ